MSWKRGYIQRRSASRNPIIFLVPWLAAGFVDTEIGAEG